MVRFWAYCTIICIVLGLSLDCIATTNQRAIESLQNYLPNEVTAVVSWTHCGDWNGFYYPGVDRLVLCEENLNLPLGSARMIFLHELGHAYAFEHKMDYFPWGGSAEDEADEFSMVMALVQGRPEDLLSMAHTWDLYAAQVGVIEGESHSPATLRAARLRSMYWGYKMAFGPDYFYFKNAVEFWRLQFIADAEATNVRHP